MAKRAKVALISLESPGDFVIVPSHARVCPLLDLTILEALIRVSGEVVNFADGEGLTEAVSAGARLLAFERASDVLEPMSQVKLAAARIRFQGFEDLQQSKRGFTA